MYCICRPYCTARLCSCGVSLLRVAAAAGAGLLSATYDPLGLRSAAPSATAVPQPATEALNSSGGSQGFNSSQSSGRSNTRSASPPGNDDGEARLPAPGTG